MSESSSQSKSQWAQTLRDGKRIPKGLRILPLADGRRRIYIRAMVDKRSFQRATQYYEDEPNGLKFAQQELAILVARGGVQAQPTSRVPHTYGEAVDDSVQSLLEGYFREWHGTNSDEPADPNDANNHGTRTAKDIAVFKTQARNLAAFYGPYRSVQTIDYDMLRDYVRTRIRQTSDGRKPPTVKSVLREQRILKAAVKTGKRLNLIPATWDPRWPVPGNFPESKLDRVDQTKKVHVRSETEIREFLGALPGWVADLFRFALYTGFRAAAIERITTSSYDATRRTITVRHKTSGSPITTPLAPEAAEIIEDTIKRRGYADKPAALLFVFNRDRQDKSTNHSQYGYIKAVHRANKALNRRGKDRIKLRDMRGTAGYLVYRDGGNDIAAACEFLMHQSIEHTRTYLGLEENATSRDRLNKYKW